MSFKINVHTFVYFKYYNKQYFYNKITKVIKNQANQLYVVGSNIKTGGWKQEKQILSNEFNGIIMNSN